MSVALRPGRSTAFIGSGFFKRGRALLAAVAAVGLLLSLAPAPARTAGATLVAAADVPTTSVDVRPITVGATVPASIMLSTPEGTPVALQDIITSAPATAIIFYRGGWCPFCNKQLAALAGIEADLQAAGCQIIGISPDSPANLKKTIGKNKLSYMLYSDSDATAMRAFKLAYRMPDALLDLYKTKYKLDLAVQAGGKDHHLLPVPAAYVVDSKGVIRYEFHDANYTVRAQPAALLQAARETTKH